MTPQSQCDWPNLPSLRNGLDAKNERMMNRRTLPVPNKTVCCPFLAESADGEYPDAHLSEVRLPVRPPQTTSNAPSKDIRCALDERLHCTLYGRLSHTPPLRAPLRTSQLSQPVYPPLPATCRIPSARGISSAAHGVLHAQLWPTWHRFPPKQLNDRGVHCWSVWVP